MSSSSLTIKRQHPGSGFPLPLPPPTHQNTTTPLTEYYLRAFRPGPECLPLSVRRMTYDACLPCHVIPCHSDDDYCLQHPAGAQAVLPLRADKVRGDTRKGTVRRPWGWGFLIYADVNEQKIPTR